MCFLRVFCVFSIALQLPGYCGWLPGCCYVVAKVFCVFNTLQFLGYCGWLPVCYYVVAKVFCVVF